MTKDLRYIVTLQKSLHGEFQEFLCMWPLLQMPPNLSGWDVEAEKYAQEHYPGRVVRNSNPSWNGILQQYTRTWGLATSWGTPTTLRLVARLWPVELL